MEGVDSFPATCYLKIMGLSGAKFETAALSIIHKHVPNLLEGAISIKPSAQGKYVSLTVEISAHSKQQLDELYRDLSAHPDIVMVL